MKWTKLELESLKEVKVNGRHDVQKNSKFIAEMHIRDLYDEQTKRLNCQTGDLK